MQKLSMAKLSMMLNKLTKYITHDLTKGGILVRQTVKSLVGPEILLKSPITIYIVQRGKKDVSHSTPSLPPNISQTP